MHVDFGNLEKLLPWWINARILVTELFVKFGQGLVRYQRLKSRTAVYHRIRKVLWNVAIGFVLLNSIDRMIVPNSCKWSILVKADAGIICIQRSWKDWNWDCWVVFYHDSALIILLIHATRRFTVLGNFFFVTFAHWLRSSGQWKSLVRWTCSNFTLFRYKNIAALILIDKFEYWVWVVSWGPWREKRLIRLGSQIIELIDNTRIRPWFYYNQRLVIFNL